MLSLYTDLIGRLGVTDKSEGSKGVCWVSGITVSRLAAKLSETEDVQSIWVFLTKLQLSSLSSCASLSLSSCSAFMDLFPIYDCRTTDLSKKLRWNYDFRLLSLLNP